MSKTLSAVVIGDLHLDGMTADLGPSANRLQIAEVAKVEAWAVRNGINEIFYTGDVCNRTIMSYQAHGLLRDLWSNNTHLNRRIIPGNHDYAEDGLHSLKLIKAMSEDGAFGNLTVYEDPTRVVINGVPVNFLGHPWDADNHDLDMEDAINVAHFEVKGSLRDNGSKGCSKKKVPADTVWIMGHLHTPHDVGNVHYVGTLYQRNFGESLPKSFTHLRARMMDGALQVKLERVNHEPDFRLINLDVETKVDLKRVTNNPLHKYKLFVSAAVRLPESFMTDHPNVVRKDDYKTGKERDAFVNSKIVLAQDCEQDDPYESLADYLEHKHSHLEPEQVERAEKIMQEIRGLIEAPTIETLTN